MKKILCVLACSMAALHTRGQSEGHLSGDLQTNVNFYMRDTTLQTIGNNLYKKYLSGGESWLSLRYNKGGFTAFARVDAFHNSNLYNPIDDFTGFGIGAFSLSQVIGDNLTVTGGYIYDQIGSGILFRAYEDRGLLIDNALVGIHVRYKVNEHLSVKGFTGQQKNIANFDDGRNNRFKPIIKGANAEGDFTLGKIQFAPGVGVLNRTYDNDGGQALQGNVNLQDSANVFDIRYNTYAFTAYNMLTVGGFSWYLEGAYKTHEAIRGLDAVYRDVSGNIFYTTLGYAMKGFSVNATAKRTDNFLLKTSQLIDAPRGYLNWQPVVARLRPQRLLARFSPPSQDISELALGADVNIAPNDDITINLNYTHINTLDDEKLYREIYAEAEYHGLDKWIVMGGIQILEYNQQLYLVEPEPNLKAITPFAEVTYRFSDNKSIRAEIEYQHAKENYGSWVFALLEYNIAPRWSFAVSDMYNIDPNPHFWNDSRVVKRHYPQVFGAFTSGPHRFTAAYVKQVAGINCSGGVCRYEPAFSGVKISLTSSF